MVDNYAEILETSLKVIFDLFLVFGIETFEEEEEEKKEKEKEKEVSKTTFTRTVILRESYNHPFLYVSRTVPLFQ